MKTANLNLSTCTIRLTAVTDVNTLTREGVIRMQEEGAPNAVESDGAYNQQSATPPKAFKNEAPKNWKSKHSHRTTSRHETQREWQPFSKVMTDADNSCELAQSCTNTWEHIANNQDRKYNSAIYQQHHLTH